MGRRELACVGMAVLVVAALAGRAAAQEDGVLAEKHFEAAKAYYNQGKYEKALEEFGEAYRLMPLPEVTYNIAQCKERLGDIAGAIESYGKYLEEKPDAPDLKTVKDKIANLEGRLAKTGIVLECAEGGATISIDGKEVATSPSSGLIKTTPGTHELKVVKAGFQPWTLSFSVAAGLSQSATVTLTPLPKTSDVLQPLPEGGKGARGGGGKGAMNGYIAGFVVSGVLLLGGAGTGIAALVVADGANMALKDGDDAAYDDRKGTAVALGYATDALIPLGAAGLFATLVAFGVKKPWKEKGSGSFSLVPAVGGGYGGLLLRKEF